MGLALELFTMMMSPALELKTTSRSVTTGVWGCTTVGILKMPGYFANVSRNQPLHTQCGNTKALYISN